jgi:wyosine [tRNA(Phe)-imidazoG37] synthetase (radical SAM superfamily)
MTDAKLRYVYGPVPSRRLGLSLGVDIVPLKTCSFNCIYCQLGRTTKTTVERRAYTPVDAVAADVATALRERPTPDFITISGSGEPTLHSRLGELIDRIRTVTHLPVAVITNGSLLWLPEVRADCVKADVVLPSLDAGDPEMFARVNRPHPDVTFERVVSGLAAFRREYEGQIWLEVFLVRGANDTEEAVRAIARVVADVKPDRVQLNTAVRPTAEAGLEPVSPERLAELAALFAPPGEVIADYHRPHEAARESAGADDVLAMLARRPATVEDLADGLGLLREEVMRWVEELKRAGRIGEEVRSGKRYYFRADGSR